MTICENCKYCDIDYEWDEEDGEEYEIRTCQKGHEICGGQSECPDFKKYREREYKEEFSECDACRYVSSCPNVIESTTSNDTQRHFTKGMGYCQKQYGALEDKRLLELIAMSKGEKFGDMSYICDKLLILAVCEIGNITYGEFKDRFLDKDIRQKLMARLENKDA